MKTLTQTTAFVFAVVSSISVTSVIASVGSVANAAESSSTACQQVFRPETSGGAARDQLVATAKCNSGRQRSTYTGTSVEQPKSAASDVNTTNVNRVNPDSSNSYLKPCPSGLRIGTTGGSIREYLEAMQKCREVR